ncbi:MAG: transposase, partial [Gemmatimonadaceae bacterium]|nr:transposase [Gemmatimonadaceae bacterium]
MGSSPRCRPPPLCAVPQHPTHEDHDEVTTEVRIIRRSAYCRYGARPAFAQDRLAWTDDGRVSYRLKRPWPDGRTELVLAPVAFLRRLCGIIPP